MAATQDIPERSRHQDGRIRMILAHHEVTCKMGPCHCQRDEVEEMFEPSRSISSTERSSSVTEVTGPLSECN